ncbi:phage tail assembly protein [Pluralibacter gergoviae]|uniref:Phage tail assembly protein n=1 Tax=Pluralibacter gergoviae TaxID=61647 RepID=A0A0J5KQ43_PLUGE|nr:tail assembly protein [Pluralibacter gergoviae]KMK08715.1 phage tail assembly protein [Pluralibacter gergoviae]
MKEILCQIELGGVLGKKFGKVHDRLIMKTGEATLSLAKTIPGFESFMLTSKERGLTYAVFRGNKNISEDDLGMPVTGDVIRIVPLIIGSKKAGMFQTILGVALVAVGAILSFTPAAAASPYLMQFGAAMALGGIVQMLSPQPKGLATKQDSDNKASYAFGGATNTTAQGNPVALLYGRRRIGGAVISAGIYVEDQQ